MKIKGKIGRKIVWFFFILILIYTRVVNLGWGLPFPMHPDERNMSISLQSLSCQKINPNCFHPHFFAYGQLPIYLGYLLIFFKKILFGEASLFSLGKITISFEEATLSLRLVSVVASLLTALIAYRLYHSITKEKKFFRSLFVFLIIIFSPFAIQFSHFGTTESLLMFFYLLLIYLLLKISQSNQLNLKSFFFLGLISGASIATKITSLSFLFIVLFFIVYKKNSLKNLVLITFFYLFTTIFFALILSPHNLINFSDFFSSIKYESDVALGKIDVFYTRQFSFARFLIFPLLKIFPYALGWPLFILSLFSLLNFKEKNKKIQLLRLALFFYLIPNLFVYTQWTRFYAPIFPIFLIFSLLTLNKIKKILFFIISSLIVILPGIAFLNIYQNKDIRIEASEWIYQSLPNNSYLLSETANVVDIPFLLIEPPNKNFYLNSFNFYDLDNDPLLSQQLDKTLKKADYIIIPSRRILLNLTCLANKNDWAYAPNRCQTLQKKYPRLWAYYQTEVFNPKKFFLLKEFKRFPKISLLGKTLFEFPDENAEETFSVFDHPVVRIYQKLK